MKKKAAFFLSIAVLALFLLAARCGASAGVG